MVGKKIDVVVIVMASPHAAGSPSSWKRGGLEAQWFRCEVVWHDCKALDDSEIEDERNKLDADPRDSQN